jgi:hypothetical protein
MAVVCVAFASAALTKQERVTSRTLVGRLATVEPANRRLTMIPEGEVERVEVFVAEDGEVLLETQKLSLSDLVIQVGRRVTILYRLENQRRIAESVIVESEQSAPAHEPAMPAIRRPSPPRTIHACGNARAHRAASTRCPTDRFASA